MMVISMRDFRAEQTKYLQMVKNGVDVILKSRSEGSFKLCPITEDDTLMSKEELNEKILGSIEEIERGECRRFSSAEELDKYIKSVL